MAPPKHVLLEFAKHLECQPEHFPTTPTTYVHAKSASRMSLFCVGMAIGCLKLEEWENTCAQGLNETKE